MSGSDERVQEALASHLEARELGAPEPDTSHLTPDEAAQLQQLIQLLDTTEGVAFGHEMSEGQIGRVASTDAGERLVATIRDALPAGARITIDPAASTFGFEGMDVTEGFIVGTFGGRVRVWLLASDGALQGSDRWLRDLERVFRLFPDTVAIALVEPDHSSLLVQPEDCAPTIEVPRGSLVGRRYRRPIHPVGDALEVFLRELVPHWEPIGDISSQAGRAIDVTSIADERATAAIEAQVAAGSRARKTNPKRTALTGLGASEGDAIAKLLIDVHEGRSDMDTVEETLRRLAQR